MNLSNEIPKKRITIKASVHGQSIYYVYIVLSADNWKLSGPGSVPSQCRT